MAGTWGAFRTTLVFDGIDQAPLEQQAVSASLEWRASDRWTFVGSAGGIFGGRIDGQASQPGGVLGLAASRLLVEQDGFVPFVQASGSLSASALAGPLGSYVGVDVRLGVAAGYTFLQRLTPYAVARVFGGPVFYGPRLGTDLYHFQLGAGLVAGLPGGVDLSVELVPLGEQRLTASAGFSF